MNTRAMANDVQADVAAPTTGGARAALEVDQQARVVPFLITIDTEGDNLWAKPDRYPTENARFLPRFQALCDQYGFKPTYLTNYEMAVDDYYVGFARECEQAGVAEVGMHLHAWNSPPTEFTLTDRDHSYVPFLVDYPEHVIRDKVRYMTDLLETTFGRRPTSHRAGRWIMDDRYFKALIDEGYLVDCSVTPHVSWAAYTGAPSSKGGADYRRYPDFPYFIDAEAAHRPGSSQLLEVPMTVAPRWTALGDQLPAFCFKQPFSRKILNRLFPLDWLRPRKFNREGMIRLVDKAEQGGLPYLEFMTHSSELMPKGSPFFSTAGEIDALYANMEAVFERASEFCTGMTLTEFYDHHQNGLRPGAAGSV